MKRLALVIVMIVVVPSLGFAQSGKPMTLTDADRTQIQQLSTRYAETLSACAAADYAALFAADGYFESGFRGRIQGNDKLIELVKSERHCTAAGSRPVTPVPAAQIAATQQGATGRILLANDGGAYEDVYVKTGAGWRFKSRTYLTSKELAARGSAGSGASR